jgi:hypothetical protein
MKKNMGQWEWQIPMSGVETGCYSRNKTKPNQTNKKQKNRREQVARNWRPPRNLQ